MMMGKRVGIYTKMFRDEDTIERAIESILNQTYKNIRYYVLVNDATREKVEKYAGMDDRVVILDAALGKEAFFRFYVRRMAMDGNDYIAELDADDWYDADWLETMLSFMENNALDVAACGSCMVDTAGQILMYRRRNTICLNMSEFPPYFSKLLPFCRAIWGKIYAKSAILAYHPEKLPDSEEYGGYGGDTMFVLEVLKNAKRFGVCEKVLHNYQVSPASASHTFAKGRRYAAGVLFQKAEEFLNDFGKISTENMLFLYNIYSATVLDTMQEAKNHFKEEEQAKLFHELFHDELTKKALLIEKEMEWAGSKGSFCAQMTKLGLEYLQYMNGEERENCCAFLCYLQPDGLLRYILKDTGFVRQYTELALMIADEEGENAMRMCRELLEKDKDILWEEELIEILLNLAALLGNTEYFILGKRRKLEYMVKTEQKEQAEQEYRDLLEMGVQEVQLPSSFAAAGISE
ncbi:MAG: glycosyltransferase [Lachnospiraceae bacterium]|nr:glycosyltransferase [Lachnospiraceae bacterium]